MPLMCSVKAEDGWTVIHFQASQTFYAPPTFRSDAPIVNEKIKSMAANVQITQISFWKLIFEGKLVLSYMRQKQM